MARMKESSAHGLKPNLRSVADYDLELTTQQLRRIEQRFAVRIEKSPALRAGLLKMLATETAGLRRTVTALKELRAKLAEQAENRRRL
ncbi:MAG: hypothetical protein ABSG53_15655 [Thermoguttaceae bacterium]